MYDFDNNGSDSYTVRDNGSDRSELLSTIYSRQSERMYRKTMVQFHCQYHELERKKIEMENFQFKLLKYK